MDSIGFANSELKLLQINMSERQFNSELLRLSAPHNGAVSAQAAHSAQGVPVLARAAPREAGA